MLHLTHSAARSTPCASYRFRAADLRLSGVLSRIGGAGPGPGRRIVGCGSDRRVGQRAAETAKEESLFDGKSLDGWKVTQFGGQGEVSVKDGCLTLGFGSSLTGVTYEKDFPKVDYEILLEARRLDGSDFFCGLTFPVEESHCSLILGGWGGGVVGLSSIDGRDASENETTQYMSFKDRTWYPIRVRVTKREITVWIQDKRVIQQPLEGRKISTRSEVNLSRPLGIAAWETSAALRNIRFRRLPAADAAQP